MKTGNDPIEHLVKGRTIQKIRKVYAPISFVSTALVAFAVLSKQGGKLEDYAFILGGLSGLLAYALVMSVAIIKFRAWQKVEALFQAQESADTGGQSDEVK